MNTFSRSSREKLSTCHPDIQRLMEAVLAKTDIIILCGHRGEAEQNAAFANHTSMLRWPLGKHNKMPSMAVDVAPYPLDWNDTARFRALAVVIQCTALELDIPIKWGGDWKSFKDLPHWEL